MKTAMQELIEYYNRAIEIEESPMAEMQLRKYRMKAQLLLEKEKEQIVHSFGYGYLIGEDNITEESANEAGLRYYNNTYQIIYAKY